MLWPDIREGGCAGTDGRKKSPSERAEWLTDKYVLALLTVFPLFLGPEGYADLTSAKFRLYVLLTAAWGLGLAVCRCGGPLSPGRRPPAALWAMAAFALWSCLSAALSPYGSAVLLGTARYGGLLSTLLYTATAWGAARLARPRRRYVWAFALSVTVCCLLAGMQLAGYNPLGLYPHGWDYYDGGVEYTGWFLGTVGNTGLLAAMLCLAIPLFTVTAMKNRGRDLLLLLPAGLALGVLLLSGISAGPVALLAAALLTPPAMAGDKITRRRLILGEGALVLAGLALIYALPPGEGAIYELSRLLHGELSDSFGSHRVLIWREVLSLTPERPLLGGGPGTLAARLDISFSRFVPESGKTLTAAVDNAHNEYLGYLAELGAPGLALYLGVMGLTFFDSRPRRPSRWQGGGAAWGAATVCYWAQAFFGLGLCITAPLLWLCWGLFLSRVNDTASSPTDPLGAEYSPPDSQGTPPAP